MHVETPSPPVTSSTRTTPDTHPSGGEVDLGTVWSGLINRWWIVLLVAAVVTGLTILSTGSTPKLYSADSTVYVGQPLGPNGTQLGTLTAKASNALAIAQSGEALSAAASASGVKASQIKKDLSVTSVTSPIASKLANPPTQIRIAVRDRNEKVASKASAAIARFIVDETNGYAKTKQSTLERRVVDLTTAVADQRANLRTAMTGAAANASDTGGAVWATLVEAIGTDMRLAQSDLYEAQAQLAATRELEVSRVITEAHAYQMSATSRRPQLIVAAFAGIGIGILVSLLVDAVSKRRRATAGRH